MNLPAAVAQSFREIRVMTRADDVIGMKELIEECGAGLERIQRSYVRPEETIRKVGFNLMGLVAGSEHDVVNSIRDPNAKQP